MIDLTNEQAMEIAQYAFVRMDGAWFLAMAKRFGIETAWEMDVEAWKQFSYVLGRYVRKNFIPRPIWPESFIDAMEIVGKVLKTQGREITVEGNRITVRITDCETQKAIAKAGVADCGIVTVQTYEGIIRALFDDSIDVQVDHTKNLNRGDPCCEVVITRR